MEKNIIKESQDIFQLTYSEIDSIIHKKYEENSTQIKEKVKQRKEEFSINKNLKNLPYVLYGNIARIPENSGKGLDKNSGKIQGIGASFGEVEGYIKICYNLQQVVGLTNNTILVIPYTDSGWGPLIANAGGIIAEVGGALSHGAIIAREYGIPAVMNIDHATEIFQEGQRVKIDGQQGIIELLED